MTSLSAFRTDYPHCTLVSELVGVEHGQYLVRCCIEQAGQPVASGLSAAPSLEAAEDQARDRAIALLAQVGVPPILAAPPYRHNGAVSQPSLPSARPETPPLTTTPTAAAPAAPSTPSPLPEQPVSATAVASTPAPPSPKPAPISPDPIPPDLDAIPSSEEFSEPASTDPTELQSAPMLKPPSSSPKVMPNGTIDFTDIIARTNLEMKRLGWTNEQGRSYLLQTYGKRSRQRLDDNELLEFLAYLESQPEP